MQLHPAWKAPSPEWVTLAPGVRWRLKRPDGVIMAMVQAEVSSAMAKVYQGLEGLEALGVDPDSDPGGPLDLERLAGYASVLTACLYARRCLLEWEGLVDPETSEPLDPQDGDAVRTALILGAPGAAMPLLTPFLAWIDAPRRPMIEEARRLRDLAKDHWSGGAERCRACEATDEACARGAAVEGEVCPRLKNTPQTPEGAVAWEVARQSEGLWSRAGLSGAVTGLDYGSALLTFEARIGRGRRDYGAAFAALQAIERGRLEAQSEQAEAERASREASDRS